MTALLTHQEVMAMDRLNNLFMDKPNPGLDFMFATATADADPGAGYIRLNNSAWGSSTYLYISKTDRNNSPIGPLIGSLMANGSHLRLFPTLDRTMYLEADISGPPVDATTYWKVPLANVIASAAMPILGTLMVVFPAPSGTPGAGYGASSTTSLANAASGSKAFTISSGKAFLPGARIRATSASTGHWMEGVVTAYASTTLTVTMDYSDGNTGTYNDWNINAAGEKGSAGPTGSAGPSGSTGADGTDPGIRFLFASSTAMGDPSAGNVRFNNATPASVTAIAFSYSCGESGNPSVANWIKNLGASTTSGDKGRLIIKKTSAPQNYIIAKITAAVADNATWGQVTVTIDDSAGSFSAADQLSVQWSRTGNQGATGAGTGDFNGPGSSTAHNLVAFADTSGNLGEDAGVAISTDGTLASNSDAKVPTQKAVKTYVDQIVAAQDAMVFKGVIDCSVNPNYPAADRGWTYRVSVAGKIGGASGPNVEAGDVLICLTDSTSSGNHATVGAQWGIVQVNLDGALTTTNATSGTSILKGNGLGGIANATAGTDYSTLNSLTPGAGLTSTLTATAPGSALTATGTLSAAELVNAQTGTSYTIVDGDRAKLVTFSNASAIAVTLPQAGAVSAFQSGWYADFINKGVGTVAITPTTSTINGLSLLVLASGQSARIVSDGTNYQITANVILSAACAGGRLTLSTGVPVMTSTVSGATIVYYTPYLSNVIPIYNGTYFVPTTFAELSQATTDTTKSPAAVTTNSNYDVFVWDDSGTKRATRGPAWSSDTARGTGAGTTELEWLNGIPVNKNAITNGPAARRGTYVGTIRSNGSSQIDWILGGTSAGGTAAVLGVWNMYNRATAAPIVQDSSNSYTYNSTTLRALNGSTGNRISMVRGLDEDAVMAAMSFPFTGGASGDYAAAISLDSTSSVVGGVLGYGSMGANTAPYASVYTGLPGLGWHYLQNVEKQFTTASAAQVFTKFVGNTVQGHNFAASVRA